MGLCKCPKKKVTNQFCFEHRVNVCEHCMVTNHPTCIVQSYLQWLQDSDYDPLCQLCRKELSSSSCVRLVCYHVFHWNCLDQHCRQLPAHTAPAGYTCPLCGSGIIPMSNMVSPVADALRSLLESVPWAQKESGLPPIEGQASNRTPEKKVDKAPVSSPVTASQWSAPSPQNVTVPTPPPTHSTIKPSNLAENTSSLNYSSTVHQQSHTDGYTNIGNYSGGVTSSRKTYSTVHSNFVSGPVDHDEDKYKRKSGFELLTRWIKSRSVLGGSRRRDPHAIYKRWVVLAILLLIGLLTVIYLMVRWGRASADSDPLLDPRYNPDIHIQDDGFADRSRTIPSAVKHAGQHNALPVNPGH